MDDWIQARIQKGDIVITNDILLAARCLKKESRVLDTRGRVFDEDNIGEVLAHRELASELPQRGELGLGPKKMVGKHRSNFNSALDELINAVRKAQR